MKRTGSEVFALTAAFTASSIFRESICLSKYSWTDIFFFFLSFLLLLLLNFSSCVFTDYPLTSWSCSHRGNNSKWRIVQTPNMSIYTVMVAVEKWHQFLEFLRALRDLQTTVVRTAKTERKKIRAFQFY